MNRKTRYLSPLMLATAVILTGVVTASARPLPQADAAGNVTAGEIGLFDRFLDTHSAIAQALAKDPSLIDNRQYVASQPALQAFLGDHPEIRQQLQTNPQVVMRDLTRFNHVTSMDASARAQFDELDNFMDAHPGIAKQLEAKPSLIDDKGYVKAHPELAAFLQSHPDLASDWRSNPQGAMMGLASVDAAQAKPPFRASPIGPTSAGTGPTSTGPTGPRSTGSGPTSTGPTGPGSTGTGPASANPLSRAQMATLDNFMDYHFAIATQLETNPSLINNPGYLKDNPELATFLQNHSDIAQEWRSNPQLAMTDLTRFDAATSSPLSRADIRSINDFMNANPEIAKQLDANPSLINDSSYLQSHPALATYLHDHPDITQDWQSKPEMAMNQLARFDAAQAGATSPGGHNPQGSNPGSDDAMSRRQAVALDAFLDAHPTLGDQLQSNPSLIDNRTFLSDHPELVAFLQSNPNLAQDWRSNPQAAMNSLARIDTLQARTQSPTMARGEVATFDAFLNDHPAITEQLRAHPTLISDSAYLESNAQLKAFLSSNPAIAEQLRTDPALFMRDAVKLHTHDIATAQKTGAEVRGVAPVHK